MRKKARNYISVFIAALFCAGMLSTAVYAAGNTEKPLEDTSLKSASSAESSSSREPEPSPSSNTASDGTGHVDVPSKEAESQQKITVTFHLNGGTGATTRAHVDSGTSVGEFSTPTRKGYQFAGWSLNGNTVDPSTQLNGDAVLTATWVPANPSSNKAAPSSSQKPVDTHQSEIDEAASRAEAAISEPDTLSSQDWNSLLNSSSSSAAAGAVSSLPSSQGKSGSNFSKLFYLGIGLIVLALAGIGLFIYLQFIRGRRGKPHGGSPSDRDSTMEFTDISSYSDGRRPNSSPHEDFDGSEPTVAINPGKNPARHAAPAPNAGHRAGRMPDPVDDSEETRVIDRIPPARPNPRPTAARKPAGTAGSSVPAAQNRRPAAAPGQKAQARPASAAPSAHSDGRPKAQARPVNGAAKSDFDWEKFFNDDDN